MRLTLLSFVLSLGFMSFAQQTINASIMHDGIQRDYILYVPASYNGTTSVPLLFNFHGYTSNASEQMWYGDFRAIADTANFIIAHPQGTLDNTGTSHFNVGWGGSTVDDVGFTSALIDTISSQYQINLDRVYSTGMSNGGYMSFHLACNLSNRIAAIGSVTGAMVPATMSICNASHMTPIIQIHGTSDGTVPYNGGSGWSVSIPAVLNHWATYNDCSLTPVIEALPDINAGDGSTVERHDYQMPSGCTIVRHFKVTGGGHTWPGTIFNSPGTNYDIDASKEVWNFMSQFDINGVINGCEGVSIEELSETMFTIYPNPSNDLVSIDGLSSEDQIATISTMDGKILIQEALNSSKNTLNVSNLEIGNYLLQIDSESIPLFRTN